MLKAITDENGHSRGFLYCEPRVTDLVLYTRDAPKADLLPVGAYHLSDTSVALYGTSPLADPDYVTGSNPTGGS